MHNIIQIAMGWQNYHLYEFQHKKLNIGEPDEEFAEIGFSPGKTLDAKERMLQDDMTKERQRIAYEYDFGDGWRHRILVEKFLPRQINTQYPICIDGALHCPPEDCGGLHGFYNMLGTLNGKPSFDRKQTLLWLGGSFDANHFDLHAVNATLNNLDEYIADLYETEKCCHLLVRKVFLSLSVSIVSKM